VTDLTDFIAYLEKRLKAEETVPDCCHQHDDTRDGIIYILEEMIQVGKDMSND
jgi:hypothetical protein